MRLLNRFRNPNIVGMMRPALAEDIILSLCSLLKSFVSYCFAILVAISSAYFFEKMLGPAIISTYSGFSTLTFMSLNVSLVTVTDGRKDFGVSLKLRDHVENLGGDGPRVAAYLRVSTSRQAKEGFSLEAQYEQVNELKSRFSPSCVYWFVDPGKSGSKDFDKRKINSILQLKEKGEIQELWVWDVSRIGRECRKLLYFFLDFCDNGARIITPEREYSLKDLASLITFIVEAHSAEKANKDRSAAAVAGKAQAFKQKHWNKPVPLGYRKRVWLQRNTDFEPFIKEVHQLFLITRSIESVRRQVNRKFIHLLSKPLSRSKVRRILSDPVYMGKPEHLGEVVGDPILAFIDEKTFQNSLRVLAEIQGRYKPIRTGPLEQLAISQPVTFLEMLGIFELHHRRCGGLVTKNGTTNDEGPWQQLLVCKGCSAEWRLPPITQRDKSQSQDTSKVGSLGHLLFDNGKIQNKEKSRKMKSGSGKDCGSRRLTQRSLDDARFQ